MERPPYRISLVNMPFAALNSPSLALTQLGSVLDSQCGNRVSVEIHYLNQAFARYMGIELYHYFATSAEVHHSGLDEWFFRQSAFPQLADNRAEYFRRYYPHRNERTVRLKRSVLDLRQGIDTLLDSLICQHKLDEADLVGFTSMFGQNVACFAMARKLKERNSDIITVMGGANCETPMGEETAKNVEHIDFVFSGPALKSFPEFVQHCLNHEMEKCNQIRGVFSKTNLGTGEFGASGSIGQELDINVKVELDYEAFLDVLENDFPDENIELRLPFETSRGCWWGERSQCTFCGLNGTTMAYRAMSAQRAIEQFESLFHYYPRCAYFESVDNTMPKSYLREVFPILKTPAGATIFYEVRPHLTAEDLQMLSTSGVKRIQPGIESLATSTLKLMRKGTTAFQNLLIMKNCVACGIELGWNLLVGFPGEGEEVYEKYLHDIPLLTHLPPPGDVYPVRFDRYSPYFAQARQYGLDLHPYDFYELVYPFSKESLANLAYYFMDHNFSAEYFVTMVKWLGQVREKVDVWRNRWYGEDRTLHPDLYFEQRKGCVVVHDSRSGELIEHQVGDIGSRLLEQLTRPKGIVELATDLSHIPRLSLEAEVASLQQRGLVFEEGGRFLSLVFAQKPPPQPRCALFAGIIDQAGETQDQGPPLVSVPRKAYRMKSSDLKKTSQRPQSRGERPV